MMQRDVVRDLQLGARDALEWKLWQCRNLSDQGQVLVTIVTTEAATHEHSFCQELC